MSEVTLTIGGRNYTVSCAPGEEDHVQRLGQVIDAKLAQLGGGLGPSESRNFLFASLLLADDLHERAKEVDAAKQAEASARSEMTALAAKLPPLEQQVQDSDRRAEDMAAERDVLKTALAEAQASAARLQEEIAGLNTQQAQAGDELLAAREERDQALAERDRLRGELDSRGGDHEKLMVELDGRKAKIGALTEELEQVRRARDELGEQIDAVNAAKQRASAELEDARSEQARLTTELEELRNAPPPEPELLPLSADPDLAPALERFAEMLETCATKLEGKATAH